MAKVGAKAQITAKSSNGARRHRPAYLFVYGTLARGQRLHRYLKKIPGVRFRGEGKIQGELYVLPGEDYPGAILSSDRSLFVLGELYEIPEPSAAFRLLDKVEGCDEGLFRRRLVEVIAAGNRTKAWTYLYAQPLQDAKLIPSGEFRKI